LNYAVPNKKRGMKNVKRASHCSISLRGSYVKASMVPSKENSTISIPVEFYGTEVEVLVYPYYNKKVNQKNESINDIFDNHKTSIFAPCPCSQIN
jgi:hypothetical protein